jgi:urea transport system permease protein
MRRDITSWLLSGAIRVLLCLPLGVTGHLLSATDAQAQTAQPAALPSQQGLQTADLLGLFDEDYDKRLQSIQSLGGRGEAAAQTVLKALAEDALYRLDQSFFIQTPDGYRNALTGKVESPDESSLETPIINNQLREVLDVVLSGASLLSGDLSIRQNAIKTLLANPQGADPGLIQQALQKESVPSLKQDLLILQAMLTIASDRTADWSAAFEILGNDGRATVIEFLQPMSVQPGKDASPNVLAKHQFAKKALGQAQSKRQRAGVVNTIFSGLSLGSILLLAALGLAITYGLIGVINMAHGEFLMIGAYSTFVMQGLFQSLLPPGVQDLYLLAAIPFAFITAAGVGWVIEYTMLRHLYGRPLETLLATFGLSLVLMQAVRVIFGAQNVQVSNPAWMSGAAMPLQDLLPGLQLPFNRLFILAFSLFVLGLVWVLLNKTRMGLFVRATTQNRPMASCVGIPTRRVDSMAFSLGTGVAGLGGVALSQIGNVGPDLGQAYIIDSFMVVVLGGVGQLAGTVFGSFGLGVLSKFSEPLVGAVLTKIGILVLIILFIQKRPSGLFALKGRSAEA